MKDECRHSPGSAWCHDQSSSRPHDFDFLLGSWIVHHKRLKPGTTKDASWERFRGVCKVTPILGGFGTLEEISLHPPEGFYHAVTIRCFDPQSNAWVVSEIDGRHPRHRDRPLTGRFRDGLGAFFSEDEFEGRRVRVRFIWSNITPTSARAQQAFSSDDGASWETTWTMEFERALSYVALERGVVRSAPQ